MRECPTGAILREAPHVFDAIAAQSYAEAGAFDPTLKPAYLQQAMAVVGAEKYRLWEIRRDRDRAKADASYGARVLRQ